MWKAIIEFDNGEVDEVGVFNTRKEALFEGEYAMGITPPYLIPENENSIELKMVKKYNKDYASMEPVEYKTFRLKLINLEVKE